MSYQETFIKLEQNPQSIYDEAVRILCKIADNILKFPEDPKIRTLQKNNPTIASKILSVNGGKECLKAMGFEETNTAYIMSLNVSSEVVNKFRRAISSWKKSKEQKSDTNEFKVSSTTSSTQVEKPVNEHNNGISSLNSESKKNERKSDLQIVKKTCLPPFKPVYSNPFLRRIETYCHSVLQYEDKMLQERARRLIPVSVLEEISQRQLRNIQEYMKKNNEMSIQDILIVELLRWFKEDFFDWVDSPACNECGCETSFVHMSTDPEHLQYTDRAELYRCKSCRKLTPFPRYNDLNILLETRRGRCGEWANTFTLCCRAMGWDSRFVVDEGDHVWTEVYSITQKRWIHCDPCENVCDKPLMYEAGWSKQISYVMAYSPEEVQDVTWRYTSDHKKALQRRRNCSEEELLRALFQIRIEQQKNLSQPRRNYLVKRALMELVEFLSETKPDEDCKRGRTSGAEMWRLARGETVKETSFVWRINEDDIVDDTVTIRYSSVQDKYEYVSGTGVLRTVSGWHEGAHKHSSVFRKEEKDWKMVYLARKEGEDEGTVTWMVDLSSSRRVLDTVSLKFEYYTVENGTVRVQMRSENRSLVLPEGEKTVTSRDLTGAEELAITATLAGGKGDVSWQHAQLFRQSLESEDFEFVLRLTFKSSC